MKYLILLLLLVGCASKPKTKIDYQNTFWLGCMNAYINLNKPFKPPTTMIEANKFCKALKQKIDENPL